MVELTLADVLAMPVLRSASPRVIAGASGMDGQVRWVHSAELADIGPLLRPGDLLLSTGIAMPDTGPELSRFAESLAAHGSAGLIVELGRRWASIPAPLASACDRLGLPLVALNREASFAAVIQAVGERIVDEQLSDLREAQRVHEIFTELSIDEAAPEEILGAVQRMSGGPVVLENELHQVLDYRSGSDDMSSFLNGWAARSRSVAVDGRTHWDPENGWLITRVGRYDRGWGRLVVQATSAPSPGLVAAAERAAAALALHRLHDRQRDSQVRRAHHEIVLALLADPTSENALRRTELAGLPLQDRAFVGLSGRPTVPAQSRAGTTVGIGTAHLRTDALTAAFVRAADQLPAPALVCEIERDVRVLLSLPRDATVDELVNSLTAGVLHQHDCQIAAGRPVTRTSEIGKTLRESQHVLNALGDSAPRTSVHRLEDVHLRGLLTLLAQDDRLLSYVDRELDDLRRHDAMHRTDLLGAVRALLEHPTSKTAAAAHLHLSRPVFYERIAKAERVLSVDLDDPHIRASLHVALMAQDVT